MRQHRPDIILLLLLLTMGNSTMTMTTLQPDDSDYGIYGSDEDTENEQEGINEQVDSETEVPFSYLVIDVWKKEEKINLPRCLCVLIKRYTNKYSPKEIVWENIDNIIFHTVYHNERYKHLIVPLPITIEKMEIAQKAIYHSVINLEQEDYTAKHLEKALISLSKSPEDKHPIYSNMPISVADVATLMLILKIKWTQIVKEQAIQHRF